MERTFQNLKTVDLEIWPLYHLLPDQVLSHVSLCMMAYYVEWLKKHNLAALLFAEGDWKGAKNERLAIVNSAVPSQTIQKKGGFT